MQRARKLLRACKNLNNTPAAMISHISKIIIIVVISIVLITNISNMISGVMTPTKQFKNLSSISMVVVLLCIRSIYTGFFEDKRQGTKNNLRALTIHLPISKKEFILAQYLGTLYIFVPAFIFLASLIVFNLFELEQTSYTFGLGLIVLMFIVTYLMIALEKGLLIYYYIDPRIRELLYLFIMLIWMGVNYGFESGKHTLLYKQLSLIGEGIWGRGIEYLGSGLGIVCLVIALGIGYILSVRLPLAIERSR